MPKKLKRTVALACGLAVAAAGVAHGELIQAGNLVLNIDGGFTPSKLPKKQFRAISLKISGDISTANGKLPAALDTAVTDFDKNGKVTTKGLATCDQSKIENTTSPAARAACKAAIVGTGTTTILIALPDQAPIPTTVPLTAFNGPPQGGQPTLLLHAYTTYPAPATSIARGVFSRASGPYRTRVTTDVPPIVGGYGIVTHFDLNIKKNYVSKGKKLTYTSARCTDGTLQAFGDFIFTDATHIAGTFVRPCKSAG